MNRINIFIPAAGFGERLKPISLCIPKPLLPVMGRPVLDLVLERISVLPVRNIGINTHYGWELIRNHAAKSPFSEKIVVFHERDILGTGGALKNAASLLEQSDFLVHNADIISATDLKALLEGHVDTGNIATLAVRDYPAINNVWIDASGRVRHVGRHAPGGGQGLSPVTYTGIAVYSPDFLRFLKQGKSEVVDAWLNTVSSGHTVGTIDVSNAYWSDIGTPDAYSAAVFHALSAEGEMTYVHPSVGCDLVTTGGRTVIESGCVFEGPASLRNCIILPGSQVRNGEHLEDVIAGKDFRVPISKIPESHPSPPASLFSGILTPHLEEIRFTLIGNGGSDRRYYRARANEKTAVLLQCPATDQDYERHMAYSRFLAKYSVPVAELLAEEGIPGVTHIPPKDRQVHALFEDLGDLSLYSWIKCVRDPERIENIYRRTLDILVKLHTVVTDNVRECPPPNFRIFDYDHLRWETRYFMENFVHAITDISVDDGSIGEEFHRLAKEVDSLPKSVLHRDFQSQNIMVMEGDTPRLIDYQGARIGPPAYDLVSLLWDPYVRLDDDMRQRLVLYYLGKIKLYYGDIFDKAAFSKTILPCGLQRHMQALGAYGFLAGRKGKKYFLKYVPLALYYLRVETESARREYPALYELVKRL